MNISKNILFITTIVTALSSAECDYGSKIQRSKRHVVSLKSKRTSYAPPPPVPFDYSDNADGFYVFNIFLTNPRCFSDEPDCIPNNHKWVILDFKFHLYNKKDPCYNTSIELNPDKISSLQSSIDEKWLGRGGVREADTYWRYCGSCSLRIPELNDEFKFFKKSIDLFDKFNIGRILRDEGITLKGDYSIDKISDAIFNALGGKHAQLGCLGGRDFMNTLRDGIDQFNEVIIFFDKQFNPMNDPGWKKYTFNNCPQNVTVHYGVDRD